MPARTMMLPPPSLASSEFVPRRIMIRFGARAQRRRRSRRGRDGSMRDSSRSKLPRPTRRGRVCNTARRFNSLGMATLGEKRRVHERAIRTSDFKLGTARPEPRPFLPCLAAPCLPGPAVQRSTSKRTSTIYPPLATQLADLLGRLRASDDRIEHMNAHALPRGCAPLLVAECWHASWMASFRIRSISLASCSEFSCRRSNTTFTRPTRGRDPRVSTRGA